MTVRAANGLPDLPGSAQYKGSDRRALELRGKFMATNSNKQTPAHARGLEKPRKTKRDRLCALLCRKGGVSIGVLQKELDWQPHTVRAAISGLRKAGEIVEFSPGKTGATYRIVKETAA